ncbi:MAG: TPM domain-containing protein [Bacilli bacterium]|nr:TPM domain-containing protein [Bacilli bacterium]
MKKKCLFLFCFIVLISCIKVNAAPISYSRTKDNLRVPKDVDLSKVNMDTLLKIPAVDSKAKIYDFADLLTEAEEAKLFIKINEYINNTGLDAVIVTTNDLQGLSLKDYTYGFYDYNDFSNSGISFVIYVTEEKKSIFMGNNGIPNSEVYKAYPDKTVTEILRYVYKNHIDQNDYVGACEEFIKLADGFYVKTFGSYKVGEGETEEGGFPWVEILIVSFVLSFIVSVLLYSKYDKPQRRVDQSIKKALSSTTMIVKSEYDKPVAEKNTGNS